MQFSLPKYIILTVVLVVFGMIAQQFHHKELSWEAKVFQSIGQK